MPRARQSNQPTIRVRLRCENLPANGFEGFDGRKAIRVELQTREGMQPGTAGGAGGLSFETAMTVKRLPEGTLDFAGPAVNGKRGERFFYLSWSGVRGPGREMFRRAKIHLRTVSAELLDRAGRTGCLLQASIHALARDGGPACASVPLLGGGWVVARLDQADS